MKQFLKSIIFYSDNQLHPHCSSPSKNPCVTLLFAPVDQHDITSSTIAEQHQRRKERQAAARDSRLSKLRRNCLLELGYAYASV